MVFNIKMAYIPPSINIIIKKKLSNNNCSSFYKNLEYFYSCQDLKADNIEECCKININNFIGDFNYNKCYLESNNKTYFEISCINNLKDDSYYKTALFIFIGILIISILVLLITLFTNKNRFVNKKGYESIN